MEEKGKRRLLPGQMKHDRPKSATIRTSQTPPTDPSTAWVEKIGLVATPKSTSTPKSSRISVSSVNTNWSSTSRIGSNHHDDSPIISDTKSRPSTAPSKRKNRPSPKPVRISIHDIINKNDAASEGLDIRLQRQTRYLLESKKRELDKLLFDLKAKHAALLKLESTHEDLLTSVSALGIANNSGNDRKGSPVKQVSTRPLYNKTLQVEVLEGDLEDATLEYAAEKKRTMILKHMLDRYNSEKLANDEEQTKLLENLKQSNAQLRELTRRKNRSQRLVQAKKTELKEAMRKGDEELRLWEKELKSCHVYVKKKEKMKRTYEKILERQKALEEREAGVLSHVEAKEIMSSELISRFGRTISRDTSTRFIDEKKIEEQKHIEAFVRVGFKVDELTPSMVLKTCLAQADIRKDLDLRVFEVENRLEMLKTRSGKLHEEFKVCALSPPQEERTTNRIVIEQERELRETENALSKAKERCDYLDEMLRPVRLGLEDLCFKLLGKQMAAFSDTARVFQNMVGQISFLVDNFFMDDSCSSDKAMTGRAVETQTSGPQSQQQLSIFQQICSDYDFENSLVALSPFNVRVQATNNTPPEWNDFLSEQATPKDDLENGRKVREMLKLSAMSFPGIGKDGLKEVEIPTIGSATKPEALDDKSPSISITATDSSNQHKEHVDLMNPENVSHDYRLVMEDETKGEPELLDRQTVKLSSRNLMARVQVHKKRTTKVSHSKSKPTRAKVIRTKRQNGRKSQS